mmetsp:Transcript_96603/g.201898  ORF Transcript_96603/g.201898 Transcript_96603/m.201898 type:complete len:301 (-) Transcript_96603:299-1201(-)|eukprot:CAMPEP_0206434164 /NCGR_PEP_ID=MMETSP0324_2-20121206/8989_1 /ASSEMBLY_ACC=CAM_ASM_000836 /TAXON_ID=2866 /ORGANISM="Crypthecodinium cohnii, Strain Seligo" /LENGTH=300 /DNA_ID=CAMNT_0053900615 /DNA_START=151 /DNA_END=1053 /DNA_ORIENTATION=+
MVLWQSLVAASVAFRAARERYKNSLKQGGPPALVRLESSELHVSGSALEEGHWWVLITATLDHADRPHLINNMIMVACLGEPLESLLGPWLLLVLYFFTGVVGWAATLADARRKFDAELWDCAAKFQTSVGSSPATYGLAGFLAIAWPDAACAQAFGLPACLWLLALCACPALVCLKRSKNGFKAFAGHCSPAFCWIAVKLLIGSGLSGCSATEFFAFYLVHASFGKIVNRVLFEVPFEHSAVDNAAHLGGTLGGAFTAWASCQFSVMSSSPNAKWSEGGPGILNALCFAWLALQCWLSG